jgi:ABC-type dipeptide/oligopeptide/nickel transport system ATPase component
MENDTINLLEVKNFSLELKQSDVWNPVLSSISFSLRRGETIGIVGESGSGKSVTALSIMQLLSKNGAKITEGNIFLARKYESTKAQRNKNEKIENNLSFFRSSGFPASTIDLSQSTEKNLLQIRGNRIAMILQEQRTALNPVFK